MVVDNLGNQEYLQVVMVQTLDDKTGAGLGTRDRLWVSPAVRYAHGAGATVQEVTLSSRREGSAYTVSNAGSGELTLTAGAFTAGNPVVALPDPRPLRLPPRPRRRAAGGVPAGRRRHR